MKVAVLLLLFVAIANALPKETEWALTPFGPRPANCVQEVPSGSYLVERGNFVEAHLDNGTVLSFPIQQDCVEFHREWAVKRIATHRARRANQTSGITPAPLDGWLDYVGYYPPKEVNTFSGTYTVPPDPTTQSNQVLFYFIGTENLQGSGILSILQPVLTWGNGHSKWNMASWNCCPGGQTWTSSFLTNIQAGGTVSGVIDTTSGGADWSVTSTYNGQNVVLTVPTAQRDFNWVDVTLETYTVTSCQQFPAGACTFENMALTVSGGASNSPSWTLDSAEPSECAGKVTVTSPSTVSISHTP